MLANGRRDLIRRLQVKRKQISGRAEIVYFVRETYREREKERETGECQPMLDTKYNVTGKLTYKSPVDNTTSVGGEGGDS